MNDPPPDEIVGAVIAPGPVIVETVPNVVVGVLNDGAVYDVELPFPTARI
jgi:hypothetical protein